MGKSLKSAARIQEFSRVVSSAKSPKPKQAQPRISPNRVVIPETAKPGAIKVEEQCRTPLAKVVSDCAKRWFQDTLKEAKAGDSYMQVLVGQMYCTGYGVPRNPQKGHAWLSKVSRSRNSVWKLSYKHPGYRASDSDSCEMENKAKPTH